MSARSISRVARTGFAAGALTVALSVPALAVPARDSSGIPVANASGNITAGTDVAAPDQQAPVVASHNVTAGTDVAAPDQQNPIPARRSRSSRPHRRGRRTRSRWPSRRTSRRARAATSSGTTRASAPAAPS